MEPAIRAAPGAIRARPAARVTATAAASATLSPRAEPAWGALGRQAPGPLATTDSAAARARTILVVRRRARKAASATPRHGTTDIPAASLVGVVTREAV